MIPKDWLKQFFDSRQLSVADKRPLYRYQMSDEEFKRLKSSLKTSTLLGINNVTQLYGWNAAFVIYAAEWWRRDYDGSLWSWEKVFTSFKANANELNTTQRNWVVESGLRYWQRDVRKVNGRSRYLGTIAIEGGLPLNQLNNAGGWLGRVFKQTIPKYTRLQHTGINAAQLVAECEYIPKNYQNDEIHTILGDMVEAVVDLKQKHRLHKRDNPVSYLDQHCPNWRELFPLPIANDVGARLLSDMITTAAKADDTLTLPMRTIRQLRDDGSVQLQIEFAGFIALETLGFSEPEKIPGRLEVELVSSDGNSHLLGAALKTEYKQKPSLKMPRQTAPITGDAALKGYAIRFRHLSETIKEILLIGGELLDNDVPWTFSSSDDVWILEGLASVNTRVKQVKILYPEHFRVDGEYQTITTVLPNKKGMTVSGSIRLTDDEGNLFIIKTAQERPFSYYYLEGKSLGFSSMPNEAYLGLPTLHCTDNETGSNKNIPANKLVARAVNSKAAWQALSQTLQGVYEIRLCDEKVILFRKKCVLLPEQFAVRFKPSANSLDGTIFLDHTDNAELICETPIRHKITRENGGYRIDLSAEQTPPSHVYLTLRWQGMVEMVTLTLPFPARGGQIIDANGNRQSSSQPLFQDQLHGIRLRLFNEQPDHIRHLQIEFTLLDNELDNSHCICFRDLLNKKGSVIELAIIDYLDWIKALLAVSRQLDSYVQLAVYENGAELMRVTIRRYLLSLERNLTQGTVELSADDHARLPHDMLNGIQLMAMRLSNPEQEHIELESKISEHTMTGLWYFYPEKRVAEPWLIYPVKTSAVPLRPILWAVDYEPGNNYHLDTEISTLHSAVKIGQTQARQDSIKSILTQMRLDFSHSGWDYLRHLWRHCPHLPLSSFDVWAIAVTDTQVLAALVLQMDEAFIEKLNVELPVFWELVPLRDWQRVYKAYKEYLLQAMEETDVNEILAKRIDKISAACQSLDVVAKLLKHLLCGKADQELSAIKSLLSENYLARMISDERQNLDRRQANSVWPTMLKPELVSEWQHLESSMRLGLHMENIHDHHRAVVVLPILLAVFCAKTNAPTAWLCNTASIFALKRLKTFDEDWFNAIFKWVLAYWSQQS